MKKGIFITFEGADGSGKTTQIELLAQELGWHTKVVVTKEPGGTKPGEKIEKILRDPGLDISISPCAELFLFAADRAQHVEEVIRPALLEGQLVISDRYYHSTLAYQHYGRGLSFREVMETIKLAVKGVEPDLTIVLDLSLEEAQKRLPKKLDRIESENGEFFQKVIAGYREIAKNHPEKIVLVDAAPDPQIIHKQILGIVTKQFPELER